MRLIVSVLFLTFIAVSNANLNVVSQEDAPSAPLPSNGAAVDEVVVESSLHIKPKPAKPSVRRTRGILHDELIAATEHRRIKRIPQPQQRRQNAEPPSDYAQSQATANAAANNHFQNKFGSGASAANAQSQAFNAKGPAGGFGASSAGTVTQALQSNKLGTQNSAGAGASQAYTLPNGQTINFAATNSFANGPGGNNANSRGSAVSVGKK